MIWGNQYQKWQIRIKTINNKLIIKKSINLILFKIKLMDFFNLYSNLIFNQSIFFNFNIISFIIVSFNN